MKSPKKQCFSPRDGTTASNHFKKQLILIKEAFTKDTVLMGDFNLDYK